MKKKTLKIETVHQCNCCLGNKTLHPLVSVIDLSRSTRIDVSIKFNFYSILLIENERDEFIYGRTPHDYSSATLVFLSPGQSLQTDEDKPLPRKGWLLAFHPLLICGTTLGMHLDHYTFFSYRRDEALHLSSREKTKILECFNNIGQELQHAVDRHSKKLISRHIELLLDYCSRFYERQFITRHEVHKPILDKLEIWLNKYIQSGKLENKTLPSIKSCSAILHLSPDYFNDLLKFETGKTIDEYFQSKQIETAKKMLLDETYHISRIAQTLGFPNTHYFSELFQKITGMTPVEYRLSQN